MTYWKQYIILFGGFQDTSNQTRYLADLWIFDTINFVWFNPQLPSAQLKPDARSSYTLLPHEQGAVLYGGYSRVKSSVAVKQKGGKGGSQAQRNVLLPKVHDDCFFLRMTQPAADAKPNTPPTVRWEKRKKPANAPNPLRAGATMAWHKGRGILFGGVHDVEQSEEGMDSEFFNQMFAWNIERNRFMPLALRKPRQGQKRNAPEQRSGRRGRGQANEEELLRNLAALEAGGSLENAEDIELEKKEEEPEEKPAKEMPVSMEPPHVRFNAQLAIQDDVLYIYGGTFEKGDREFTFDDLYAIDLGKLDGCKEVFTRPVEDWIVSVSSGLAKLKLTRQNRSLKMRTMRMMRMRMMRRTKMRMRCWKRNHLNNYTLQASVRRSRPTKCLTSHPRPLLKHQRLLLLLRKMIPRRQPRLWMMVSPILE